MASAARVLDVTTHGGNIIGPGAPTVLIGGKPAAVAGDTHMCAIPANTPHPVSTPFPMGSVTVMIENKPALRVTDMAGCGAMPAVGEPTVHIG
ncbi:PAAR domain-containing protein [Balneolaceae bacterium ANBcel3]|nr:PAAR domain-containing protein [Balneolaceae bacterium ANBcel3]